MSFSSKMLKITKQVIQFQKYTCTVNLGFKADANEIQKVTNFLWELIQMMSQKNSYKCGQIIIVSGSSEKQLLLRCHKHQYTRKRGPYTDSDSSVSETKDEPNSKIYVFINYTTPCVNKHYIMCFIQCSGPFGMFVCMYISSTQTYQQK